MANEDKRVQSKKLHFFFMWDYNENDRDWMQFSRRNQEIET